jgi:hypothetical protein
VEGDHGRPAVRVATVTVENTPQVVPEQAVGAVRSQRPAQEATAAARSWPLPSRSWPLRSRSWPLRSRSQSGPAGRVVVAHPVVAASSPPWEQVEVVAVEKVVEKMVEEKVVEKVVEKMVEEKVVEKMVEEKVVMMV